MKVSMFPRLFNLTYDNELIDSNPMRRVRMLKESPSREIFIPAEEGGEHRFH